MVDRVEGIQWDELEVAEFFNYNTEPLDLGDEGGRIFRASDGCLAAEVVVLPSQEVVCFTLLGAADGRIVLDVSVHPKTGVSIRRKGSKEYLYCQECIIIPGIRAYADLLWANFPKYTRQAGPVVSVQFTWAPHIGLQFFDPAHHNRAMG